mmetsp:Transcript_81909/g.129489  ORF Transcript_81909/g.129489 Transcript_81909/m.129489 type:complete len:82 (-) Transcript_81909:46-291(-)
MTVGLDWRRRRTQELDASRGVGGGIAYANVADMRPVGVCRHQQAEVCLRGWHAYKGTIRHLDRNAEKLTASCPDMRAFLAM